jgi:hypothetical protein
VCVRFRIYRYVAVPSTNITEEFETVIVRVDYVETAVAAAHTVVKRQPTGIKHDSSLSLSHIVHIRDYF